MSEDTQSTPGSIYGSIALSVFALLLAIIALACSNSQLVASAFTEVLASLAGIISLFDWTGGVARLVYVMSACGATGAIAHRYVIKDRERTSPVVSFPRPAPWWWTVGGTMLVGMVAANVLHFPLASVFDYTGLLKTGPDNDKPYLSIIALALLAGYAGPGLLDVLARKFQDSVASKLEERLKAKESIIERTLQFLLLDILTRRVVPNATDLELLRAKYEDIQRNELEAGLDGLSALDALVAGYYLLETERYQEGVKYLEYANTKSSALTTDGQKWTAKNLLALAYHYDHVHQNDWFKKVETLHSEALAAKPSPVQAAITRTNIAYAQLDNDQFEKAVEESGHALALAEKFSDAFDCIRDVALIARAAALTLSALKVSTPEKPADLKSAMAELKKVRSPAGVRYLVADDSIPEKAIVAWRESKDTPPEVLKILD